MKTWLTYRLVTALSALFTSPAGAQSSLDIETYHYLGTESAYTWMPIVHLYGKKNVYSELRYNYEETGSFSAYMGRTFPAIKDKLTIIPTAGVVVGNYTGLSLAVNNNFMLNNITICSQSQYTVSLLRGKDFFYSWSDIYYDALPWLYAGFAFQNTVVAQNRSKNEAGLLMGFRRKRWSIPFYLFNGLSKEKYFIIGINAGWNYK